jgi:TatD DNase family protein
MIDFHCHLDDLRFEKDRDKVIKRAKENRIKIIINPSVDFESFKRVLAINKKFNFILPMLGVHPHNIGDINIDNFYQEFESILQKHHHIIIGIGEIGLDFYHLKESETQQKEILEIQLKIAEKFNLPVVFHIRESFRDIFSMIKKYNILPIWHSFIGDYNEAKKFLDLNGYLSISGIITFLKANQLRSVIKKIPLDRLLIETDAPYLTPEPLRGKRNEPSFIKYIYAFLESYLEYENLEEIISQNFDNIFANKKL